MRAATSNGWPGRCSPTFLWPFEVTAILLVVAVVGGVVLARRSGLAPETEYELERDDDDTTQGEMGTQDSESEVTTP